MAMILLASANIGRRMMHHCAWCMMVIYEKYKNLPLYVQWFKSSRVVKRAKFRRARVVHFFTHFLSLFLYLLFSLVYHAQMYCAFSFTTLESATRYELILAYIWIGLELMELAQIWLEKCYYYLLVGWKSITLQENVAISIKRIWIIWNFYGIIWNF